MRLSFFSSSVGNFLSTRVFFYVLWFLFLPPLLFSWNSSTDNLQLQTEYTICLLHLFFLSVIFFYVQHSLACSEELYLSHNIIYTFHWVFVLGSFLGVSFMDPMLSWAAAHGPALRVYTTVFIMARLGGSIFLMLLGTFFLITLALKPKEVDPIGQTKIGRRGSTLIWCNHGFSRENSLYRRYLNPCTPITIIAPVVLLSNHLFELNLPFGLLFFLGLSWLLYGVFLLYGALSFYCALAPLEARTYRYGAKIHSSSTSYNKNIKTSHERRY